MKKPTAKPIKAAKLSTTESQCFRCDGTGNICDVCGESESQDHEDCEENEFYGFSDCEDCNGTGK